MRASKTLICLYVRDEASGAPLARPLGSAARFASAERPPTLRRRRQVPARIGHGASSAATTCSTRPTCARNRVFNPVLQGETFDPEGAYCGDGLRRWVARPAGARGPPALECRAARAEERMHGTSAVPIPSRSSTTSRT